MSKYVLTEDEDLIQTISNMAISVSDAIATMSSCGMTRSRD